MALIRYNRHVDILYVHTNILIWLKVLIFTDCVSHLVLSLNLSKFNVSPSPEPIFLPYHPTCFDGIELERVTSITVLGFIYSLYLCFNPRIDLMVNRALTILILIVLKIYSFKSVYVVLYQIPLFVFLNSTDP